MPLTWKLGWEKSKGGREAVLHALENARAGAAHLERPPDLALIFATPEFTSQEIRSAAASLRGSPVIGCTTPALIGRELPASGVVAVLAWGDQLQAESSWLLPAEVDAVGPDKDAAGDLVLFLSAERRFDPADQWPGVLGRLAVAGGISALDGEVFPPGSAALDGEGLSAIRMSGEFSVGLGAAHGWQPVGPAFEITRADGFRLESINSRRPVERYAAWFRHSVEQWRQPPYDELVRMYPIGVDGPDGTPAPAAPLHVDADGCFEMSAPIRQGAVGRLMVGSSAGCANAARAAAEAALAGLAGRTPRLALVFADLAWKRMMESRPFDLASLLGDVVGREVPIAGAYTQAQFLGFSGNAPGRLNQHCLVVLFGD